ncbi:hypothetical protein NQZ68_027124 [Dissostichus eleginoides]|nr:hypothetical protein NQZ68_027124 [Dissostichus eleginoides]
MKQGPRAPTHSRIATGYVASESLHKRSETTLLCSSLASGGISIPFSTEDIRDEGWGRGRSKTGETATLWPVSGFWGLSRDQIQTRSIDLRLDTEPPSTPVIFYYYPGSKTPSLQLSSPRSRHANGLRERSTPR